MSTIKRRWRPDFAGWMVVLVLGGKNKRGPNCQVVVAIRMYDWETFIYTQAVGALGRKGGGAVEQPTQASFARWPGRGGRIGCTHVCMHPTVQCALFRQVWTPSGWRAQDGDSAQDGWVRGSLETPVPVSSNA